MKLIELKCPNCASTIRVNSDEKEVSCDYCGTEFLIDDEIRRIQYENAEQAGYEFEKGRQRAQAEQLQNNGYYQPLPEKKKKKHIWLWVIGWIFMFPVPVTILMVRNRKLNKWLRIGIIAAAWLAYLAIGYFGEDPGGDDASAATEQTAETAVIEQQGINHDAYGKTDSFVYYFEA